MSRDRMQSSRFELKYLIDEPTATRVRDFVLSYLSMDENGVGKADYSYPVRSLYLDSDDLDAGLRHRGAERRFWKASRWLRVRFC